MEVDILMDLLLEYSLASGYKTVVNEMLTHEVYQQKLKEMQIFAGIYSLESILSEGNLFKDGEGFLSIADDIFTQVDVKEFSKEKFEKFSFKLKVHTIFELMQKEFILAFGRIDYYFPLKPTSEREISSSRQKDIRSMRKLFYSMIKSNECREHYLKLYPSRFASDRQKVFGYATEIIKAIKLIFPTRIDQLANGSEESMKIVKYLETDKSLDPTLIVFRDCLIETPISEEKILWLFKLTQPSLYADHIISDLEKSDLFSCVDETLTNSPAAGDENVTINTNTNHRSPLCEGKQHQSLSHPTAPVKCHEEPLNKKSKLESLSIPTNNELCSLSSKKDLADKQTGREIRRLKVGCNGCEQELRVKLVRCDPIIGYCNNTNSNHRTESPFSQDSFTTCVSTQENFDDFDWLSCASKNKELCLNTDNSSQFFSPELLQDSRLEDVEEEARLSHLKSLI